MKTAFKRSVILFLSLCIAFESISCGGGGYFMEYDMLFDRNFLFESGKKTTSYNAWIYNEDLYNDASPQKQNAKSWAEYLENVYIENDLEAFIYRSPSEEFNKTKELKKLRAKRISDANIAKKETLFLDFMEYALNVERVIAENTYDPWEEEQQEINLGDFEVRINQGLEKIQQLQDAFMKERYAFQLIKLYRYSNQYNELEKAYKTYFSNSTSMLSYWAMEHYAGILAKQNKPYEANYYFIKVYTNCPSKRVSSYLSMKLETATDFKKTLAHCATTEEKMALHYVRSMQTKALGLEDLQFITKSAGNHEYARIIMAHEINKLEQGKLLEEETAFESDEKLLEAQIGNYRKELITFNEGMLAKEGDDQFWHLSLAYLYYLDRQYDKCSAMLGKTHPKTRELQKQHDIIYIINYLAQRETLTEIDENIIGNKLYSLNDNKSSYPLLNEEGNEYGYAFDEYNTINEYIFKEIYKRYETKNAFLKLTFSGGTMTWDLYSEYTYENDSEEKVDAAYIDRVLNDLQKTPETRLALFAADHYFELYNEYGYRTNSTVNFDQCEILLKEFKATLLMRDPDHLAEAVAIFSELPKNVYNENIYGDPFAFDLKNPNFGYYYDNRYSLPSMSKYEFAQKLNDLNAQKSTAQDYYKLGMAYYNTSYYGLQWNAMAYHRTSSSPNGNYSMDVAQTFFKKALAFGGMTDEEKAKVYFMLARCEQNQYTQDNGEIPDDFAWYNQENEHLFDKYMQTMKESGAQSNFEILSKKYKKTRFYQEMIEECKYFGYYLN